MTMPDKLYYLKEGKQTLITPELEKIESTIKGNSIEKIGKILSLICSLKYIGFNEKLFRRRTASQIVQDGTITGCTDSTLIFVALSRACGIPAKYVETVNEGWLNSSDDTSIQGHQYAQVWIEEKKEWIWIDPMGGRIDISSPEDENKKIFRTGLDSWDIGITDFETLSTLFLDFKHKNVKF